MAAVIPVNDIALWCVTRTFVLREVTTLVVVLW